MPPDQTLSSLCDTCRPLHIHREAFQSLPSPSQRVRQLGFFSDVRGRALAACPLCRLIVEACERDGAPIAADDLRRPDCRLHALWEEVTHDPPRACLQVWVLNSNQRRDVLVDIRMLEEGVEGESGGGGRMVSGGWIDFDSVKDWLRRCEETHACGDAALGERREWGLPEGFVVIDVKARCLMRPPRECRYLALSYVWGGGEVFKTTAENVERLGRGGALDDVWGDLPPTIRDAIVFTQKVGERYVWIDSLCIEQDSLADSMKIIGAMDTIYRHAVLVVWAADDRAPTDGLRGVSLTPRKAVQHVADVGSDLKVLARFDHTYYLAQTRYRTRGWTYQEEQLSTRAAIFVNDQIYLTCPGHVAAEDISDDTHGPPDQQLLFPQKLNRFIRPDIFPAISYFASVHDYTTRNLTYSSDVQHAFRGAESVIATQMSTSTLSTLPTCLFDTALLWRPLEKLTRRPGFPSWSWTGWQGSVAWRADTLDLPYPVTTSDAKQLHHSLTEWLRHHTWITWHHLDPASGALSSVWTPSEGSVLGYDSSASTIANPYGRSYPPLSALADFQAQSSEPISLDSHLLRSLPEGSQPLVFRTIVLKFAVQASNAYLKYGSVEPEWEPRGRKVFLILDRTSLPCGYVLLDESWVERAKPGERFPFVLLSEANAFCNWARPHEYHPYAKSWEMEDYVEFHVVMVRKFTLAGGLEVCERVGLGRVRVEAVREAQAEETNGGWKEVIWV